MVTNVSTASTTTVPKTRRTHRAMREEMQARLIEATAEVLIEEGYAKASVQTISTRAGVTKGALFRHYESRADLLAAAAEHVFTSLIERFATRFASLETGPDFGLRIIRLLREHMADPLLFAARELQTAARTDEVLKATLQPVLAGYHQSARGLAAALFPNAERENPHFTAIVDIVIAALNDEANCNSVLVNDDEQSALAEARLKFLAHLAESEVLVHEAGLADAKAEGEDGSKP